MVFTSVGIIQVQDENGENYYCIRFTDGETSTTLPFTGFKRRQWQSLNATHISCTTKGCSKPTVAYPNLWGTKCTKCDSDCTKTTTNYDMFLKALRPEPQSKPGILIYRVLFVLHASPRTEHYADIRTVIL